jgi:hypothetical protein
MMSFLLGLVLTADLNPEVGRTGFSFLKVTPTAREAAMGSTGIGLSDNLFGIWCNPAGLAGLSAKQLGVGYISYLGGVQSGAVAFALPADAITTGFGGYYLNSGRMARMDENMIQTGTFSASFLDLNLAGAKRLARRLELGVGVKVVYSGIDTFWTLGLAGNVGASYLLTVNGLRVSAAVRNLGAVLKPLVTKREELPLDIALGIGFQPSPSLALALEAHQPVDNDIEVRLGAEAWVHKYVCARLGITTVGGDLKSGGGSDILAGLSTGLGVKYRQFVLDYAFTPMVILGNAHRVSFRYSFE